MRASASGWHAVIRLLRASMACSSLASATASAADPEGAAPQTRAGTACSKAPLQPPASAVQGHVIAVCARVPPLQLPQQAYAQPPAVMQPCTLEHTVAEHAAARSHSVMRSLPCSPLCQATAEPRRSCADCQSIFLHDAASLLKVAHFKAQKQSAAGYAVFTIELSTRWMRWVQEAAADEGDRRGAQPAGGRQRGHPAGLHDAAHACLATQNRQVSSQDCRRPWPPSMRETEPPRICKFSLSAMPRAHMLLPKPKLRSQTLFVQGRQQPGPQPAHAQEQPNSQHWHSQPRRQHQQRLAHAALPHPAQALPAQARPHRSPRSTTCASAARPAEG